MKSEQEILEELKSYQASETDGIWTGFRNCPECGEQMKYIANRQYIAKRRGQLLSNIRGANKTNVCCKKCANRNRIQTNLERYGVEYIGQNEGIKEQIKLTNLEKYGPGSEFGYSEIITKRFEEKNILILEELKLYQASETDGIWTGFRNCPECGEEIKSCSDKRSVLLSSIRHMNKNNNCCKKCANKNRVQTNLERYGVGNQFQSEEIKKKSKKTNLERYGDENYTNIEQAKQTNLEKYGVEFYTQTDEYKEKSKITNMAKYGVEHASQSEEIKEQIKETNLERYGVESYTQTDEYKEKTKITKLEKYGDEFYNNRPKAIETTRQLYGVDHCMQSTEFQLKAQNTNMEKYGVKHSFQSEEVKEKSKVTKLNLYSDENYINIEQAKQTNLEKYGFEYPMQNKEVQDKVKATNLKLYDVENVFQNENIKIKIKEANLKNNGVEYPMQNKEVQNKAKATNLKIYGVEYIGQNKEIKEQIKETNLEKYGVEYPAQNPEVFKKMQMSSFKIKQYKETNLTYQGSYELYFLEQLDEIGVLNEVSKGKSYDYELDKKRVYHSDYLFRDQTIEIKSTWTYNRNGKDLVLQEKNETKWQAVRDFGDEIVSLMSKPQILEFCQTLI